MLTGRPYLCAMKIVFMGTPQAAVPTLERCIEDGHEVVAVWTQPDRPSGRGNRLTAPPVKEVALSRGIEVFQPTKLRNDESLTLFRSHRADLAIVVAYGRILPDPFLATPALGCINVHFSLLPKYRGAAPVNWAIVRGEHETGVTTMLMDSGLDTGDILLQESASIGPHETAPALMEKLSVMGAGLLSRTLKALETLEPTPQENDKATFAPILAKDDGLIDWALDAHQIERRVRGFQPWPNAFTRLESKRLVIWSAETEDSGEPRDIPGQIVEAMGDRVVIACGEATRLVAKEVQPEGKRRMPVRDFLNGVRLAPGQVLG
jgi:methionyl-tRNA formyltransferase